MECKVSFTSEWLWFAQEALVLAKRVGSLKLVKLELWFRGGANRNIWHQGHVWTSHSEIWEGQCRSGRTLHDKCVEDLRQRIWVHQKVTRKKERKKSILHKSLFLWTGNHSCEKTKMVEWKWGTMSDPINNHTPKATKNLTSPSYVGFNHFMYIGTTSNQRFYYMEWGYSVREIHIESQTS